MPIETNQYRNFSRDLHAEAGHKPIVAQMELTYHCQLHCQHCYTECFNKKESAAKELSTNQIKNIMDKCKAGGVVWFCFTGGDPLARKDFCELYLYAKESGFITTVFSSLAVLDNKVLRIFRSCPPFGIETTLNAATAKKYKEITKTGLFKKHILNIKKLLKNRIPVRVKTQVTKQNAAQVNRIKNIIESFGLDFRPSTMLNARFSGGREPCFLRLDPKQAASINRTYGYFDDEEPTRAGENIDIDKLIGKPANDKLLTCAAGGHAFWINPQGKMLICGNLRMFDYDLLRKGSTVKKGFYSLYKKIHGLHFKTKSICRFCRFRSLCKWCPGRAILETGSTEKPIDYFCRLTEETIKLNHRKPSPRP